MPGRSLMYPHAMAQPHPIGKSQHGLWRLSLGVLGLLKKMALALWRAA